MNKEFKPFGLTECKKKYNRRRKLSGETIFYNTFFEPKGLSKDERRFAIDEFKHPSSKENKIISEKMIEDTLDKFFKVNNIKQFEIIGGIHSSSNVVNKILKLIEKRYPNKIKIIPNLILKTRMRNTFIKQNIIDKENSLKTKEKVPLALNHSKRIHYDKVSKVSYFPTRFRRYVGGFLKINNDYLEDIKNKRILLIDDTFGEGLTLCESSRLLKPYIKSLKCVTVMRDFYPRKKTKERLNLNSQKEVKFK